MHATKSRPNSNRRSFHKNVLARKTKRLKISQAALDYLISWGWVLIIIVLTIVVLYSLGVFHIPSAPTVISGFQGITMQAAQANSTMMVVKLTNNYHQVVNITGVTVSISGRSYSNLDCQDSIIPNGQTTLCRVPVIISTNSYLSNIQISFTPYRSQIYEVSNGTVSSTLVSGTIPINSQTTYFLEQGLQYGRTFTVSYNTSTNSTVVSSTTDKVSFNLPFGSYQFSIPTVTYQGCVSYPNPSSGLHATGVEEIILFKSNCTTTFIESGLPSNQQWQVTYNGTTSNSPTGSSIVIYTNNIATSQVYYTAVAKSSNLACVSYKTPSIILGGSYTFTGWNCTTLFSESSLPQGYTWNVSYNSLVNSSSTSSSSPISIYQVGSASLASSSALSQVSSLHCNSSLSAQEGSSSNVFSPWSCTTAFNDANLPSGDTWWVDFNGNNKSSTSSTISFSTASSTTKESWSANQETITYSNDCTPTNYTSQSGSATTGSSTSLTFTGSTSSCTTTFTETGLPATSSNTFTVLYDGTSKSVLIDAASPIVFTTGQGSFTATATISNLACTESSTVTAGSSYTFSSWTCTTTFTESGFPQGQLWNLSYDGTFKSVAVPLPISFTTQTNSPSSALSINAGALTRNPNFIVSTVTVGSQAEAAAYDPINGYMYVANYGSNTVSVINSSNSVIATFNVGSGPNAIAYDPSNYYIYVATSNGVNLISTSQNNPGSSAGSISMSSPTGIAYDAANNYMYVSSDSNNIYVINLNIYQTINNGGYSSAITSVGSTIYVTNGSSNTVEAIYTDASSVDKGSSMITVGANPYGIASDPANNYVYVTNLGSNTVSVISGTSVTATISVGAQPRGVAYDNVNKDMYVANSGSNTVSVINSSNSVISIISVGNNPYGVAFDSENTYIYVTDSGSNKVSVLSSHNSLVTRTLPVGGSAGIAYCPTNNEMYFANFVSSNITVLTSTNSVLTILVASKSGTSPSVAYNPANGYMYITNDPEGSVAASTIYVMNSANSFVTNITTSNPAQGLAYDPANQYMYVTTDEGISMGLYVYAPTPVNGAPIFDGGLAFSSSEGTVANAAAYDPANGDMYVTGSNSGSNQVSALNSLTVVASIGVGPGATAMAYDPANGDMYVVNKGSSSNSGSVSVIDSATNTVIATVNTGTNPVAIAYDNATGNMYVANLDSNSVSVIDSATNTIIATIATDVTGGIAYDPNNGDMYLANEGYSNAAISNPIFFHPSFSGYGVHPSSPSAYPGSTVAVSYSN